MTAIRKNARGEITIPWFVAGGPDLDLPKTLDKLGVPSKPRNVKRG